MKCPKCNARLRLEDGGYFRVSHEGVCHNIPQHLSCFMCGYYAELPVPESLSIDGSGTQRLPKNDSGSEPRRTPASFKPHRVYGAVADLVRANIKTISKMRQKSKSWVDIAHLLMDSTAPDFHNAPSALRSCYCKISTKKGQTHVKTARLAS